MRHTYILLCSDDTLYTGITTDLKRRLREHNHSPKGATYTKGRRPVQIVRSLPSDSRSSASQEEYRIKQLSRTEKFNLINKRE